MTQEEYSRSKFDRVLTGISGLPGFRQSRPTTVRDAIPIVGELTSYIIQSVKTEDGGVLIFLEVVDAEGRARFILPNKVCSAIYRQRDSLFDRSTPIFVPNREAMSLTSMSPISPFSSKSSLGS